MLPNFGKLKIICGDACRTLANKKSSAAMFAEFWQIENHLRRYLPNFGKLKIIYGDTCRTLANKKSSAAMLAEIWQIKNHLRRFLLCVISVIHIKYAIIRVIRIQKILF
ncbi:MAG: hypothetical protein LBV41_05815 [Cytophagaceae bacterium]|jgi:hypothetical protein|nr:hypothetical protein [Cytophagaceae bacterium]